MIYAFKNWIPAIDPTAYVHPQATIIGNVVVESKVFIGAHAVLRGDIGSILVRSGANVQENCTLHMFPGKEVVLEKNAHIGHGAVIHGAHIGADCLIGMNSVIMDEVVIDSECIIGAMSFVKSGMRIPSRSIYAGNPARMIREVSEEMMEWKRKGTEIYHHLTSDYHEHMRESEALDKPNKTPVDGQVDFYQPWKQR